MLNEVELWISIVAGIISIASFFYAKDAHNKVKSFTTGDVKQSGKSNNNQNINGNNNKQSNTSK